MQGRNIFKCNTFSTLVNLPLLFLLQKLLLDIVVFLKMNLAQGLLLNEEALNELEDNKKDAFVYEWLQFLLKVLKASHKVSSFFQLI